MPMSGSQEGDGEGPAENSLGEEDDVRAEEEGGEAV